MDDRLRRQPLPNTGDSKEHTEALRSEFPGLPDFHRWEIKEMLRQFGVQKPTDRDVLNHINAQKNGGYHSRTVDNGNKPD